jgi:hypothetical protein
MSPTATAWPRCCLWPAPPPPGTCCPPRSWAAAARPPAGAAWTSGPAQGVRAAPGGAAGRTGRGRPPRPGAVLQLLVRDHHPVIAAAVEGDVDRVSERSHSRVAPPCFLNVTVTVETTASCTSVTPGAWRRRGADASTWLNPAVRPLRSATSPSQTSPACDTRPSPSPVTVRGRMSLVAYAIESPPELGC